MNTRSSISTILTDPPTGFKEYPGADAGSAAAWDSFISMVRESKPMERERWQHTIRRELREDGLTFTLNPDPSDAAREEELNPIPWIFSAQQWRKIEQGIAQRARVLEAVARDLLGPRTLITRGVIPAELIFSDSRYLHPCISLPPNMGTWLFQYAADIARGPDGQFRVIEDRTQVPSGAGYALESRTIMGRVFPKEIASMQVRRLAPYFRKLRESMLSLYKGQPLEPRVVLMTPGPYNPSYFEHAYLAAYLGYTLVQGNDLLVRNGQLKLKTLEGLQPVDILYRQVDAEYLDPLELKRDSFLGVPGVLGAMREGRVATLNHPGCGLLENAGLLAFLAPLCRQLLGEELLLPSVATWWCGQPKEYRYVLEHLAQLVVKPLHRKWDEPAIDGRFASKLQLSELKRRIESHPQGYVAQEPMSYSSLPTLVGDQIVDRMGSLRSFAFAKPGGDYEVMPGALARSGGAPERGPGPLLLNKGVLKDVWVLDDEVQVHQSLWVDQEPMQRDEWFNGVFTSRSAENLFWVGRIAERVMRQARLVRGMVQMQAGGLEEAARSPELLRMVKLLETYSSCKPSKKEVGLRERVQKCLSGEKEPVGSLQQNLRSLLISAYAVRDIWSQDSWRILTEIEDVGKICSRPHTPPFELEDDFGKLIGHLNAFYGLNAGGMTRESGWSMLMLGRVIEAGMGLCQLLKGMLDAEPDSPVSYAMMEIALEQNESLITYRRHYRTTPKWRSVIDLMTASEMNPRSLAFYLEHANLYLDQLPPPVQPDILQPLMYEIRQIRSRLLTPQASLAYGDDPLGFTKEVTAVLEHISNLVSSAYFSHTSLQARENF
ncbi:circularly permuted type 2 ATP-grasp protein [Kiritimatiellota bacterium B12222]|nr:circularly permuted type 2 ATP-grasp protein [Kiritimatiellota bacterium B12222]